MKLKLLLFLLSLKMRNAGRKNKLFCSRLQTRTGSILIRTADSSSGRLFVFSKGSLFTKNDPTSDADVKMIWKDASTAFKAMTSKDPLAIIQAMDNGDVRMEGDMSVAQWFSLLVKALKSSEKSRKPGKKVTVIGLGKMGAGIAKNIQEAGYELIVFNRTPEKAQPFIEKGAIFAENPAEAASMSDIVVTCLMDDTSVWDIVTSETGILSGMKKGGIHLCATTISPDLAKKLTQLHIKHGTRFVTGTVVGRPDAAESGELLSLMGGDKQSIEECRPVCLTYSAATLIIGEEPYLANYAKLSVNYFAVANMELMGQLYAFGDATGIGRQFYARLFEASYANPILKMYTKKILERKFHENVGFELSGGYKDVKLMQDASNKTSGSLDYASIIISKMEKAIDNGLQNSDWCVFTRFSEKMNKD